MNLNVHFLLQILEVFSHNFFCNFIYLLLAIVGLHCYASFSLVVANVGYSLVVAHGLLIEVASLVAEHRLLGTWIQELWLLGAKHRLNSCGARA